MPLFLEPCTAPGPLINSAPSWSPPPPFVLTEHGRCGACGE